MRRHVLVALLFATLLGAGALVLTSAATTAWPSRPDRTELTGRHSSATIRESSSVLEAGIAERTERVGELARSEGRASVRHLRPADWIIAVALATATITALTIVLARRRPGRAAVRAGRLAPSRAPPLSLSFS